MVTDNLSLRLMTSVKGEGAQEALTQVDGPLRFTHDRKSKSRGIAAEIGS